MRTTATPHLEAALERIDAALGPGGLLRAPEDLTGFGRDVVGLCQGRPAAVARPKSTEQVAAVVETCRDAGVAVVPQGGNTGFCGGAIPDDSGNQLVVALAGLQRIRDINLANDTITVEAGCTLAQVQAAAAAHDRLFPVSHGGEGSSQIGGNIATNAGGNAVLRHGNMREQVLGLEVVLPDGRVWDGLRGLRKDNTGYDLKQLFIGAEGTLGIVTAAVLRLQRRPGVAATALAAVAGPAGAVRLLRRLQGAVGETVMAFELIPRSGLELHFAHVGAVHEPFGQRHDWQVLLDVQGAAAQAGLPGDLEAALGAAIDDGLVPDAVIAQSARQAAALWRYREGLAVAQVEDPGNLKNDTSVPVGAIPDFIDRASAAVARLVPDVRPIPFGHIGDGNIHFNLSRPLAMPPDAFVAHWPALIQAIENIAVSLGGSISAEHGLGQLKRDTLGRYKSATELDLMRRLKRTLDPDDLMNPGKVLPGPTPGARMLSNAD